MFATVRLRDQVSASGQPLSDRHLHRRTRNARYSEDQRYRIPRFRRFIQPHIHLYRARDQSRRSARIEDRCGRSVDSDRDAGTQDGRRGLKLAVRRSRAGGAAPGRVENEDRSGSRRIGGRIERAVFVEHHAAISAMEKDSRGGWRKRNCDVRAAQSVLLDVQFDAIPPCQGERNYGADLAPTCVQERCRLAIEQNASPLQLVADAIAALQPGAGLTLGPNGGPEKSHDLARGGRAEEITGPISYKYRALCPGLYRPVYCLF